MSPISFVGKVVDEKGDAVAGATVDWRANNNPDPANPGTDGSVSSDENGIFRISSNGIALFVKVSKAGYYSFNDASNGTNASAGQFSNAIALGNTDRPMGTEHAPAMFVLRTRGDTAFLIHVTDRPIQIPKDGTPVDIALDAGKRVGFGKGHLRIECWTNDQNKDGRGSYPWRCQVSVPGGGLAHRQDEFAFEAPLEGYRPSDELAPAQDWSPVAERQYFVKTGNSHFARVSLRMRTGGEHFLVIESYFNPVPHSRNLEAQEGN
ncbi:MAG TPA: carboxypeptidase-like regulatory domain-containing protein [Chthoniobacterales bacterium]|jgi:hypothetical protein|nr:carboxypeptidase-like regulatory domain-containing protein [Chthoniobacterales bacterium]